VAAGVPIEAVETAETITLPRRCSAAARRSRSAVRGDSMVGEGILDGDLVVVESRPDAPNGATVVALVRGDATVKKLQRERRAGAPRAGQRAARADRRAASERRDPRHRDRRLRRYR